MNNLVQNIATKTSVVVYYHPSLTKVFLETKQANVTQVEISIPHKLHNSIIGAKGRLIRSIMEECGGVSIKFPPEGGNSDKIIIRGPKDDADKAKKQLQQLANEKVQYLFRILAPSKDQWIKIIFSNCLHFFAFMEI